MSHRLVDVTEVGFLFGVTVSFPSKVLPHDSKARRLFVTSGGLKKVQEIEAEPGSALQEYINAINNCFPEEIVRYTLPACDSLQIT